MTAEHTKKKHPVLKVLAVFLAIALTVGAVYSHFGGFGTGKCADQTAFRTYAKTVKEIVIPESTEIIAIGEATHGNAEFAEILLENDTLSDADSSSAPGMRDRMMAENILWIQEQEAHLGRSRIFVSAHNGHATKFGSYGPQDKVMGNLLADELGEDHYYVIGTDFFRAEVNLPRADHSRIPYILFL